MATFKKLSFGIWLVLVVPFCWAEDVNIQPIGPFGTLNNFDNPLVIPSSKAQDLLNVEISPGGASVKKREGFAQAFALPITTSATHGVYKFFDSSANEVVLAFNDTYMSSSINGAAFTTLFSTGPNGATYQCVDSQGFAYCNDTTRVSLIKTNGTTYSFITTVNSTGSLVAVSPERLITSGFSEAPSRIDFSKSADFTSWEAPFLLGTDPNQITVAAPGPKITHIVYAFNRLMWFKDSSFGYVLTAPNLASWQVRTISPVVGTLDNASIYWNDVLYWRGQDGHFYSYDGSNIQRMSREIGDTIAEAQSRTVSSWTQTTSSDFDSGSFNPHVYGDTVTVTNQLQLTFPDRFGSYRDGSGSTKGVWLDFASGSTTGSADVSSGVLEIVNDGGAVGRYNVRTVEKLSDYSQGTTYYFTLKFSHFDASSLSRFYLNFSSVATTSANPDSLSSQFTTLFISTTFAPVTLHPLFFVNSITNDVDGSLYSSSGGPTFGNFSGGTPITFYLSTTTYQLTVDSTLVSSGTHSWANGDIYAYLSNFKGSAGASTIGIDDFEVYPETMTYRSAVHNAPSLTSWDAFLATTLDQDGSHSFFIRADTNSFTVDSATPSWTAITPGQIPTASTGTYFQIRDDMSLLASGESPILYDFKQSWFEGGAADKVYGTYFDYALWWNVQLGTTNAYNNYVIRYDMINNGFLLYDIPMNGAYVRSNDLYFGGSSDGYIYKFGGTNDDNGSAINAFWKSKEIITSGSPFNETEYTRLSVLATSVQNSLMTITYTFDASSSTAYTMPLYGASTLYKENRRALPLGSLGTTFNVKFGNNAKDQPFEVFALEFGYREKSWRPSD
jgi:hypothetical protein